MNYSVFQPCLQGIKKISTQIRFLFSAPSFLFLKRVMFCKNKCAHVYTQLHMLHNQFHGLMVMLLLYTQFFFCNFPSLFPKREEFGSIFYLQEYVYFFWPVAKKKLHNLALHNQRSQVAKTDPLSTTARVKIKNIEQ